jgi:antitoxin VapB
MTLNIKSQEAHRLARELAEARGGSMTEAVTEALRQSLRSASRDDQTDVLLREVAELQRFVAELPDRDLRSPDEILGYGPGGLPS